jgi:ABC-type sugar transport systems, permease components
VLDIRGSRKFPFFLIVFLGPAAICYTLFMIYPLAESLILSFFSVQPDNSYVFSGFANFVKLFTDSDTAPRFWGALKTMCCFHNSHAGTKPHRAFARLPAGYQGQGARILSHCALHADSVVSGDYRLYLAAHPQSALGCRRIDDEGGRAREIIPALARIAAVRPARSGTHFGMAIYRDPDDSFLYRAHRNTG